MPSGDPGAGGSVVQTGEQLMEISLVVAMDRQRGIGQDNQLPWRLPADRAWFREVTNGYPMVMGRRTHETIGRALPERLNIIMTRNRDYQAAPGCVVVHDVEAAIRAAGDAKALMVLGGTPVYEAFLPRADRIYLTEVHGEFGEADTFFPPMDYSRWEEIRRIEHPADERNAYSMSFVVLRRREPPRVSEV